MSGVFQSLTSSRLLFWSVIIGGTSMASTTNTAANTALLAFMITWSMLYTGSVGCYGWAVAQETASQATRPKTIAFTLICQQLTGNQTTYNILFLFLLTSNSALLLSSVFPYFINPDQLNWGGKIMFLFVGAEIFILAGLYFAQPETKNRTYADIDVLYANKIPARKFRKFIVVDGEVVPKASSSFLSRMLKA